MKINYKLFLILLFIIAVGICTGSFFEAGMADNSKSGFFNALSNFFADSNAKDAEVEASIVKSFFSSFCSFLPALLVGYLSAFLPFLLPLVPLYIFTRGISVGFSAAAILETFGMKGVLYILTTLMPPHLIQLPVCCFLGILSMQTGREVLALALSMGRKSAAVRSAKKSLSYDIKKYSLLYLGGSALLVISCLLQVFLLQGGF